MHHFSLAKSRKPPSHKNIISNPLPFADPSFTIKLFEAKLTVNLAKMGEMQSYVKVLFCGVEWNTSVSGGHMNPKWREVYIKLIFLAFKDSFLKILVIQGEKL
jgi:C2 domain